MEIFGIGPLELLLILLLALIIMGPQDMAKFGRTAGRWLRKINLSPTVREVRNLPYRLMREAGLEELDINAEEKKPRTPPVTPVKGVPNNIGVQGVIPPEWVEQGSSTPKPSSKPVTPPEAPAEWTSPPPIRPEDPYPGKKPDTSTGERPAEPGGEA